MTREDARVLPRTGAGVRMWSTCWALRRAKDCHAIGGCGVQHRPVCARIMQISELSGPLRRILFRPVRT